MAVSLSPAPTPATIRYQHTACPLCRSRQSSPFLQARSPDSPDRGPVFTIVRCCQCGLCYTNPRPSPTDIGRFYPAEYSPYQLPQDSRSRRPPGRHHLRNLLGLDDHALERGHLPRLGRCRLLDFGCGSGGLLRRMHQRGWHVLGIDASETAVRRIQSDLGLDALLGSLPHPELLPESFDVITMWQSLEHVHQPLEVLHEAYRLLAPGGMLIVGVPNIDGGPAHWFGPAWYGLDLPRHLTHFAPHTLSAMIHQAGFQVRRIQMVRQTSWLQASARRASPTHWLTRRPLARLAALYCLLTRQCDCITAIARKPPRKP